MVHIQESSGRIISQISFLECDWFTRIPLESHCAKSVLELPLNIKQHDQQMKVLKKGISFSHSTNINNDTELHFARCKMLFYNIFRMFPETSCNILVFIYLLFIKLFSYLRMLFYF